MRQTGLFGARRLLAARPSSAVPDGGVARRMVTLRSAGCGWVVEWFVEWLAG
jgi:hypothetical protein